VSNTSRQKGKAGEREWARTLRSLGVEAERGVQYQGGPDSPDVRSSLPVHWEVKRSERLRVPEWLAQAKEEAPSGVLPVVVSRRNREQWVAHLPGVALVRLVQLAQWLDTHRNHGKACDIYKGGSGCDCGLWAVLDAWHML